MPVTTFDIPRDLLVFMDELTKTGKARNRREIVLNALRNYVKLQGHRWNGPVILIDGVRNGLISKRSIAELALGLSDEQLYQRGKNMGRTLRDNAMARQIDLINNPSKALQMLEDFGWGKFTLNGRRITITDSFLPVPILHGYLETALGVSLTRIDTAEEILVLDQAIAPEARNPS